MAVLFTKYEENEERFIFGTFESEESYELKSNKELKWGYEKINIHRQN